MDLSWVDDVEDEKVEHMVSLIDEGVVFTRQMFSGGQTAPNVPTDAEKMKAVNGKRRGKAKVDAVEKISKKPRSVKPNRVPPTPNRDSAVLEEVAGKIQIAVDGAEGRISAKISSDIQNLETKLLSQMEGAVQKLVEKFLNAKRSNETIREVLRDIENPAGSMIIHGGESTWKFKRISEISNPERYQYNPIF